MKLSEVLASLSAAVKAGTVQDVEISVVAAPVQTFAVRAQNADDCLTFAELGLWPDGATSCATPAETLARIASFEAHKGDAEFAAWDQRMLRFDFLTGLVRVPAPLGFSNAQDEGMTLEAYFEKNKDRNYGEASGGR